MINTLSILIPTYNNVCVELVKSLQAQASLLSASFSSSLSSSSSSSLSSSSSSSSDSNIILSSAFEYEILVADDGSTDSSSIESNRIINSLEHCRYIERKQNTGRAAIRNFLAREAKYPWLLFIDSNMQVISKSFLARYRNAKQCDVIYGGYQIKRDAETQERFQYNLRYTFELASPQNGDYRLRQANPYADFHTSNFMVKRNILLTHPFDERFTHYGYEDVIWGKTLKDNHIHIEHMDNPLGYPHFIGNMSFLLKTEESLCNLYQFRKELKGYSKVIDYAHRLKSWHLYPVCQRLFPLLSLPIKARLTGNKPSIFWFNIYKLLYYIHLDA